MVTKAEFDQDPYQRREVVTAELDWVGDELCRRTGRPRVAAGTKGDYKHLRGAHRSQDFIVRSPLCTSRTYTRQDGLSAEQERHVAGFDFTPGDWGTPANRALMRAQTARLRAAMLDGRLAGVREVIGTLDGRTVSGTRYDGESLSSDDSHLEHWHLTLDRRRCRDQALMERIVAIALGEDDDMPGYGFDSNAQADDVWYRSGKIREDIVGLRAEIVARDAADATRDAANTAAIEALAEAIKAGGGSIDAAPIVAAVNAVGAEARSQFAELQQALAAANAKLDEARHENERLNAALAAAHAGTSS